MDTVCFRTESYACLVRHAPNRLVTRRHPGRQGIVYTGKPKLIMKKAFLLLFLLPAIGSCIMAQGPDPIQQRYASELTAESAHALLSVMASAEFEGRGTGEPGGEKAAAYIAEKFKSWGLRGPVDGAYYQPVKLSRSGMSVSMFSVNGQELTNGTDFYLQANNPQVTIHEREVVFIGYGISEGKYDDLAGVQIKDKVVLLLNEGEPIDAQGNSLITGTKELSEWSTAPNKRLQHVMAQKPKLILAASANVNSMLERFGARLTGGRITLDDNTATPPTTAATPIAQVTLDMADAILRNANMSVESFKAAAKPQSRKIKSPVRASFGVSVEPFTSDNVLGLIEGSDLKDEVLIITGHYDHDGKTADGRIFYGADDNGSGTVGMMEVARAFATAKADGHGPRRSILFIGFTAEEKGLLGSAFYVENPVIALDNTVANLNLDMIGRIDDKHLRGNHNYIHLIGADKLSSELDAIAREANANYTHMELDTMYNDPDDPTRIYYRSDQYNFAKHNIPVIFFFSGLHPHYHTPEDTIDKIDFEMMAKRTRLVFHTAWGIANRDRRPAVDSNKP